jgi:predicted house-cleaning noncanonical NTP pyrophosphatase (MazG superfamily)
MFKLILNGLEEEYDILTNANGNSFTVVRDTKEEGLSLKDKLTVEALKLVKYKQREGVYSIVENKEYANKYLVEELSDKCQVTYYLIDHVEDPLASVIARISTIEAASNISSEAIIELATVIGGEK